MKIEQRDIDVQTRDAGGLEDSIPTTHVCLSSVLELIWYIHNKVSIINAKAKIHPDAMAHTNDKAIAIKFVIKTHLICGKAQDVLCAILWTFKKGPVFWLFSKVGCRPEKEN